jgi:hypothetical protein
MHSYIVQDWLVIKGAGSDSVTQDEAFWVDLEAFQDVVFYIECREATSSPTLALQTAPAKDESLFSNLVSTVTLSASGTPQIVPALMPTATVPLARYVRWKVTGPAGGWDATFRIIAAANSPGM